MRERRVSVAFHIAREKKGQCRDILKRKPVANVATIFGAHFYIYATQRKRPPHPTHSSERSQVTWFIRNESLFFEQVLTVSGARIQYASFEIHQRAHIERIKLFFPTKRIKEWSYAQCRLSRKTIERLEITRGNNFEQ